MNGRQQRQLAWEAFQEGVRTGGDSSPSDADHEDIRRSNEIVFDRWWRRRLASKASAGATSPQPTRRLGR